MCAAIHTKPFPVLLCMQEGLSRYESERGTAGRGTPPEKKDGQPRLDLLLQQTYKHQVVPAYIGS